MMFGASRLLSRAWEASIAATRFQKVVVTKNVPIRSATTLSPPRNGPRSIPNVERVLLVGSGKGGVGKSTTAGN